ncbi:uncharacterized protein TrAtP1_002762 [Trichoderma atroviride]|uniref:uncharacterized protein n=1 Tax=Hypocrea atroviridis TaxID=63577 RepID=UPI00331C75E2|nr:hypothetical protein TrAtP1_002762 [Trichoderma atroviride]
MVQKVWRRNFAAGFGLEKALEAARSSSAPVAIQSPPGGSSPRRGEFIFLATQNTDHSSDHINSFKLSPTQTSAAKASPSPPSPPPTPLSSATCSTRASSPTPKQAAQRSSLSATAPARRRCTRSPRDPASRPTTRVGCSARGRPCCDSA